MQLAGSLLNWVDSYLSDRFQNVKMNSSKSDPFMFLQGKHLGPFSCAN
jgi:hypothetical protein